MFALCTPSAVDALRPDSSRRELRGTPTSLEMRGQAALSALAAAGWSCRTRGEIAIAGDTFQGGSLHLARHWHTPGEFGETSPSSTRSSLTLFVEGAGRIRMADVEHRYAPGSLVIRRAQDPLVYLADSPSAFVTVRSASIDHAMAGQARTQSIVHDDDSNARSVTTRLVLDLVNSLLNSSISAGQPGFAGASRAVDALTEALIAVSIPAQAPTSDLVERARLHIAQHAREQSLTVAKLASTVNVSARWLQEEFNRAGLNPSQEMRRERLLLVERTLESAHLDETSQLTAIVLACGFSSVRAFRRAKESLGRCE